MPHVEETTLIKASPQAIYDLISKTGNLAKLVDDLKIKTIEKGEDYQISEWEFDTDKETFRWRQRENFDQEMMRVDYAFIEGDFKNYDARWQITGIGEESELTLNIDLNTNIDGLRAYLYWLPLYKQLREIARDFLQAVRDRLELSYG